MSEVEDVDALILGSGQGGKQLAWHLGRSGKKVAVVERRWVGGSCPAVACLPSKNELWSAKVAHIVHNAKNFGTEIGSVTTNVAKVRQRKNDMVDREKVLHLSAYKASGAELIMGSGRFTAPKTIEVGLNDGGTRILRGNDVVINVGSHAAIPNVPGLLESRPLTHIEALELDYAPERLIILGGGYVGIEMAQTYRRFGSRVVIIEPGEQLMGREDADVASEMLGILVSEGIEVFLGATPIDVQGMSGDAVAVVIRSSSGDKRIEGSDLLVAVGRAPNTSGIGLNAAGVDVTDRGFIRVNESLQTTAPGVWAIGECAGSPQFTHVSVDDFRIVRENMAGGTRKTSDRLVPHVMFTDPPLARVGMDEGEAQRQGVPVRVARLPMSHVLRTNATDEVEGFMKILVGADDDRILGFSMIGAEAGEVMTTVQTAMLAELPYPKLRDAVIAHLTYAEGLGPLLGNVPGSA
ncbi:NAD(P)/FAD-dependent oxidoreductase [Hyphomicrobium sp. MC1]|uniref:dihydrolipoyl dehydrogenase family protein n=1 Tax=Hyphomicrobium sp. (strain MC1) TaxID=717785 RepID=UPI000213D41D|nr:FAD-dependent oxidoreductase [Hyphomicrobium sp. MC1]CCB68077.1 Pyridine nucleotide-disulphide oxidoreductase dimerisation region [Hyphomicrobium sp. MC1]